MWSLVRLLCASALLSRNTHAGSFLLCYQGADRDREVEEERGGRWREGTRGDVNAPSLAPLPLPSIFATSACARPRCLESAAREDEVDEAGGGGGRVEKSRSEQPEGTTDDADASCVARRLFASIGCICDKSPGSSLLCCAGAGRDWDVEGRGGG